MEPTASPGLPTKKSAGSRSRAIAKVAAVQVKRFAASDGMAGIHRLARLASRRLVRCELVPAASDVSAIFEPLPATAAAPPLRFAQLQESPARIFSATVEGSLEAARGAS